MRFGNLSTKARILFFVVCCIVVFTGIFIKDRYSMHTMDEMLEDISATREIVIRAYSDDGSYEDRTVADPDAVGRICDTFWSLKMKVIRFRTLKDVVYEVRFFGADGELTDTVAIAPENNVVGISGNTFRIKSEIGILEYVRGLYADASGN